MAFCEQNMAQKKLSNESSNTRVVTMFSLVWASVDIIDHVLGFCVIEKGNQPQLAELCARQPLQKYTSRMSSCASHTVVRNCLTAVVTAAATPWNG